MWSTAFEIKTSTKNLCVTIRFIFDDKNIKKEKLIPFIPSASYIVYRVICLDINTGFLPYIASILLGKRSTFSILYPWNLQISVFLQKNIDFLKGYSENPLLSNSLYEEVNWPFSA